MAEFDDKFFYPCYKKPGYKAPEQILFSFEPTDRFYVSCKMCNSIICRCDDSSDDESNEYTHEFFDDFEDDDSDEDDYPYSEDDEED
jgi:hypothetical protein